MTRCLAVLGFVLALGCSDVAVPIDEFATEACGCKDKECARSVMMKFSEFLSANSRARGDAEKANAAAERLGKCLMEKGITRGELLEELGAPPK